jgi:hypothetical protein
LKNAASNAIAYITSSANASSAVITPGKENDMIGLMGLSDNGTMYAPNGKRLMRLPLRMAMLVQKAQHWIAVRTWR